MNAQFHTPSFGDEVFDLTDIDTNNLTEGTPSNSNSSFLQQQHQQQLFQQQSKRMRGSMDNSLDEYHSANDDSFVASNNISEHIASPTPTATATVAARKQLTPTDPNEPTKPLSAYALFFRDTVSAIKQQNPNCSFQELSRIVASMWEALDSSHKIVYNKKNEIAKNEYIKNMRIYRQQQAEQQQQLEQMKAAPPMQSKPAVFTITRTNSDNENGANGNMNNYTTQQQQQQSQPQLQQAQFQQQFEIQQQQSAEMLQQPADIAQEQTQVNNLNSTAGNCIDSNQPPAQQMQLLTEAGSVQKCIRDSCTKRAIINPDWEDEYCSNECVVIHCRNVFSYWVQANLGARSQ